MEELRQRPEVEFLILADRVEAINGKLYMMGGGWDQLNVVDFDQPVPIGFAIGILVPWGETNVQHPIQIWVEHEDGTQILPSVQAEINVGRPPTAIPGQPFRTLLAVNGSWKLSGPGTYRIMATVDSGEPRKTIFHAHSVRSQAQPPPSARP